MEAKPTANEGSRDRRTIAPSSTCWPTAAALSHTAPVDHDDDFDLTLEHAERVLGLSGIFIDFAKIAVGMARLYTRPYLMKKLAL